MHSRYLQTRADFWSQKEKELEYLGTGRPRNADDVERYLYSWVVWIWTEFKTLWAERLSSDTWQNQRGMQENRRGREEIMRMRTREQG